MTDLHTNQLIEIRDADGQLQSIFRILELNTFSGISLIDVVPNHGVMPFWVEADEFFKLLASGKACVYKSTLFSPPPFSEEQLETSQFTSFKQKRDEHWELIKPLVENENASKILSADFRGKLISKRAREKNIPKIKLYRILRKYFQRGQTVNALLPDFFNCGGRNKRKKYTKKPGKRSRSRRLRGIETGIILTEEFREIMVNGGRLFYELDSNRKWQSAYIRTLHHFCPKILNDQTGKYESPQFERGEVFSFDQFKYHVTRDIEKNLERFLKNRYGKRIFNMYKRPRTGTAREGLLGPGMLYQIDATIVDDYIVDKFDRSRIVGRPVVFAVGDPFSSEIVGIAVMLESESWSGYCMALLNVLEEKVTFCADYGIKIEPEMWPNSPMPSQILGDRGSMESRFADILAVAFGVQVSNAAPYRPDWKGFVEQIFRLMNIRVIHLLPGRVPKQAEPGARDYRLDACLDLYEFTQLIIKMAIHHNNNHRLTKFKRDEDMIRDKVEPYPIDLRYWGMQNRPTSTRYFSLEEARLHLLPQASARVTGEGIVYKDLLYICEMAIQENWMLRASELGNWGVDISYDPRSVNLIYLRFQDGRYPVHCALKDENSPYRNLDWVTYNAHLDEEKLNESLRRGDRRQSDLEFELDITDSVRRARKKTKEARARAGKMSKSAQTKGIHANKLNAIQTKNRLESERYHETASNCSTDVDSEYTHINVPHPVKNTNKK